MVRRYNMYGRVRQIPPTTIIKQHQVRERAYVWKYSRRRQKTLLISILLNMPVNIIFIESFWGFPWGWLLNIILVITIFCPCANKFLLKFTGVPEKEIDLAELLYLTEILVKVTFWLSVTVFLMFLIVMIYVSYSYIYMRDYAFFT